MKLEDEQTTPTQSAAAEKLKGRYTLVGELGQGAQGKLFLADDSQTGQKVAVKELDLKLVDEWKAVELFERETKALESLDHPGIPSYVDAFHQAAPDGSERFFLVQQYVEGTPLDQQIERGELMDEARARRFLHEMLSILDYMQSLNPPVVHRDIKPSNIIVCPDGSHVLVDFGAVQTILPETVGGSTVVGTTGFMPPEQLMGRATSASDIYALGATVVNAMSGIEPSDFQMVRMKLQFHDYVEASQEWFALLDRMLDPAVESRLQDTSAVFAAMDDPAAVEWPLSDATHAETRTKPAQEQASSALVSWEQTASKLSEIESSPPCIPMSAVISSPQRLSVEVGPIAPPARNWTMPFVAMAVAFLVGVLTGGCLLVVTFPLAIWLTYKGRSYLRPVSERLEMTPETLTLEKIEHRRIGGPKVTSMSFAVDQLYLPHVHRVSVDTYQRGRKYAGGQRSMQDAGALANAGEAIKPGKPGLIFSTTDGETAAFGDTILSKHRFIQVGLHDDHGELDWLDDIVTEYMTYVRGGAPDE